MRLTQADALKATIRSVGCAFELNPMNQRRDPTNPLKDLSLVSGAIPQIILTGSQIESPLDPNLNPLDRPSS